MNAMMTEQELRIEEQIWQDRLAEAQRARWADGIRNCRRNLASIRRRISAAKAA